MCALVFSYFVGDRTHVSLLPNRCPTSGLAYTRMHAVGSLVWVRDALTHREAVCRSTLPRRVRERRYTRFLSSFPLIYFGPTPSGTSSVLSPSYISLPSTSPLSHFSLPWELEELHSRSDVRWCSATYSLPHRAFSNLNHNIQRKTIMSKRMIWLCRSNRLDEVEKSLL